MPEEICLTTEQFLPHSLAVTRTSSGLWRFMAPFEGDEVEVLISGNDQGPDPTHFELARRVAVQLNAFVSRSRKYLRHFVDECKLGEPGEWEPVWAKFGVSLDEFPESFEVLFSHSGETHDGVWGVRFFRNPYGFRPYEFRRIQR